MTDDDTTTAPPSRPTPTLATRQQALAAIRAARQRLQHSDEGDGQ